MFRSLCLHRYPSPSTHSSPAGNIVSCTTLLTINPTLQPSSPNVLISSQFLRWPRKFSDNSSSLLTISRVYGHLPPGLGTSSLHQHLLVLAPSPFSCNGELLFWDAAAYRCSLSSCGCAARTGQREDCEHCQLIRYSIRGRWEWQQGVVFGS